MPLSPKQIDFIINSTHSFNISSGVASSGKTFANNLRWYEFMRNHVEPGSLVMMSGKTKETLYDNVVREIEKLDDCGCIGIQKSPLRLYMPDRKIEAACVGADDESSWGRIQGKTVAGWYADEIVEHPESLVNIAVKSCRQGGRSRPKFWTCNPDNPNHFVKKNYIDNPEIDKKNWFWGFKDNPTLEREYIRELEHTLTGVFKERLFYGRWVAAEGNIFSNFDPSFHVVDKHPEIVEYYASFDWGFNNPLAALLIGVDSDDVFYVLDEFYERGRLVDESLNQELREKGWDKLGPRKEMPYQCYYDVESPSDAQRMLQMGWNMVPAVKHPGSVNESIKATQQRFQVGENGRAKLYILGKCTNTIGEVMGYQWRAVKGAVKDEPVKKNDHAVDCLKGFVYSRDAGKVRVVGRPKR